jgi:hypothetical protein
MGKIRLFAAALLAGMTLLGAATAAYAEEIVVKMWAVPTGRGRCAPPTSSRPRSRSTRC